MNNKNPFSLEGKTIVVMGVANKFSIAAGIAETVVSMGGTLILTYQEDEKLGPRVKKFAETLGEGVITHQCDVGDKTSMDAFFTWLAEYGPVHGLVHSIAFAGAESLQGPFVTNTTLEAFQKAMHISCYSLVDVSNRVQPIMTEGGSIITLSFYAATQVFANYNVMGVAKAALEAAVRHLAVDLGPSNIRVNTVSASPMKTLAASGIGNKDRVGGIAESMSPLSRRATLGELGATGAFLLSNASGAITGSVVHANCGVEITAHAPPWNAAKMRGEMELVAGIEYQHVGKGANDDET